MCYQLTNLTKYTQIKNKTFIYPFKVTFIKVNNKLYSPLKSSPELIKFFPIWKTEHTHDCSLWGQLRLIIIQKELCVYI